MVHSKPMKNITDIDPSKVSGGLHKYAGQYVVLSTDNKVVGNGRTYREALRGVVSRGNIALFPIPEADIGLAP